MVFYLPMYYIFPFLRFYKRFQCNDEQVLEYFRIQPDYFWESITYQIKTVKDYLAEGNRAAK